MILFFFPRLPEHRLTSPSFSPFFPIPSSFLRFLSPSQFSLSVFVTTPPTYIFVRPPLSSLLPISPPLELLFFFSLSFSIAMSLRRSLSPWLFSSSRRSILFSHADLPHPSVLVVLAVRILFGYRVEGWKCSWQAGSSVCPTVKPSVIAALFSFFCGREQLRGTGEKTVKKIDRGSRALLAGKTIEFVPRIMKSGVSLNSPQGRKGKKKRETLLFQLFSLATT